MSDSLTGGCACGHVRYRLASAPIWVNCCHCTKCQTQTGSAFVINAMIETDRIEGAPDDLEITTLESGGGGVHDIYRCPACRVALWSDYGRRPFLRFIRVGTLDDSSACPPNVHVFTGTKLDWVRLPDDVPAFEEYFDIKKYWPEESLERLRVARESANTDS